MGAKRKIYWLTALGLALALQAAAPALAQGGPRSSAEIDAILSDAAMEMQRDRAAYGSLQNPGVLATKQRQLEQRTDQALAAIARRDAALNRAQGQATVEYIAARAPQYAAEARQAAQQFSAAPDGAVPVAWYAPARGADATSRPIQPTVYTAAPAGPGPGLNWYNQPALARYGGAAPSMQTAAPQPMLAMASPGITPPSGKTGPGPTGDGGIWDPIEPVNRALFSFNEVVDTFLLRPVAWLFSFSPDPVKRGLRNVLGNLKAPVVTANHALQGDLTDAATTTGRFLVNSTLGLLGIWDAADDLLGWHNKPADFGQTLYTYGIGDGPYVFLPLLGPHNTRDAIGLVPDILMDPWSWIFPDWANYTRTGATALSKREELLKPLDELRRGSVDYYASLRSAAMQNRARQLRGDAPPSAAEQKQSDDMFNEMK